MGQAKRQLILGSASRWRQLILARAGFDFSVMVADIDEKGIRHADPQQLALAIAKAKAAKLLSQISTPAILITVDQVVVCNNEIFEKPESADQARYFMQCYNHHSAATVTAVVLTDTVTGKEVADVDIVNIEFNHIPEAVISDLIAKGEIMHCAGGFQIEDERQQLNPYIRAIDGDIDSVQGIPIKLLNRLLVEIAL